MSAGVSILTECRVAACALPPEGTTTDMNPNNLRSVIRELNRIARTRGSRAASDWEHVRPLVTWVWDRLPEAWPRLRGWFREGLTVEQYDRYVNLARRLPNRSLNAEERRELLDLTLRGLRLGDRLTADVDSDLVEEAEEQLYRPAATPAIHGPLMVSPTGGTPSGFGLVRKLDPGWLEGALSVMEGTIAPGAMIPPHTHAREDEISYVIEGELTFEIGTELVKAAAGSYVIKPIGVSHATWNAGTSPARAMEIYCPGGFAGYYDAIRELDAEGVGGDARRARVEELQARYGVTFHSERVAELAARHGVAP